MVITLILLLAFPAKALPKYSEETGLECAACHTNPKTGDLNEFGREFKVKKEFSRGVGREVVFIVGSLHLFSAVFWIGAIIFVHVILTPDIVVAGGAPKKELLLGWTGIFLTGITGFLLTYFKYASLEELLTSESGKIVLVKIFIYLFMLSTAVLLTFKLNKKFRESKINPSLISNVDIKKLERFDRIDDKSRVLVSVFGLVYDFSSSKSWKDGIHAGYHKAWRDLTEEIKNSPHGLSVLERFKPVGYVGNALENFKEVKSAVKAFKIMAYANLLLGVLAVFLGSYIRWMT
ncbi:cytochrome b5 [Ferroglobus placidus DSM 10642]|uniref:Cytochrome b5 n=1 Tax=Ferroglobus placidus (strain DSM 10642 / AEDII12DO) TaxID=589924 RepID=D3RX89_FERPA|nr:cytochrome b5 [Ferroglobus placidus DSM 10642]